MKTKIVNGSDTKTPTTTIENIVQLSLPRKSIGGSMRPTPCRTWLMIP